MAMGMGGTGGVGAAHGMKGGMAGNPGGGSNKGGSGNGNAGKPNNYPGYRGPTGTRNPASQPQKSPTKTGGWGGGQTPQNYRGTVVSPSVTRATQPLTQDYVDKTYNGATMDDYGKAMRSWGDRISDYEGEDEDFIDWIGNKLADLLGFEEQKPQFDISNLNTLADWDWDPVETALTVGGLFNPVIGIGSKIYSGWEMIGGPRPTVNMGTSVFGDDQQMVGNGSMPSTTANGWGGLLGSGMSGKSGPGAAKAGTNGGNGDKENQNGGFGGQGSGGNPTPIAPPKPPAPKPTPQTQAQTPQSNVSYYLPIKDKDTGAITYQFEGHKMNNPNFGLAQGWGANVVFL